MKLILLEDESLAAERLSNIIHEINADIEIVKHIKSVEEGIRWFEKNKNPDLIISDIRLLAWIMV